MKPAHKESGLEPIPKTLDQLRRMIIARIMEARAHNMIGESGITLSIIEDEFRRFGRED